MKPRLCVISVVLCAAVLLFSQISAISAQPAFLRVGLSAHRNVSAVPIGNSAVSVGFIISGYYKQSAVLSTKSAFSVVPLNGFFISAGGIYSDYETALQEAQATALNSAPALIGDNVFAVYAGPFDTASDASVYGANVITLKGAAITQDGQTLLILDNSAGGALIKGADTADGFTKVGGASYRGYIEPYLTETGLTAVNVINIEEYLYSVVPSEMPPTWHIEALKAQAVAARSYAATRLDTHSDGGYNFCDTIHCQLYQGVKTETEQTTLAVLETAGVMAYYDNEPINAVYSASSGGATADSEKVWSNTIPYLRAVPDPYETTGHKWQREFTLAQISGLAAESGYNIGNVVSVTIASRSPLGHVDSLLINGELNSVILEKDEIRTFFSKTAEGSLQSRLFGFGAEFLPPTAAITPKQQTQSIPEPAMPQNKVYTIGKEQTGLIEPSDIHVEIIQGLPPMRPSGELYALSLGGTKKITAQNAAIADIIVPPAVDNTPAQYITTPGNLGADTVFADPVIITGTGYGHGVGLSQHGARGMAEAGYTYKEILRHYYTGIDIR